MVSAMKHRTGAAVMGAVALATIAAACNSATKLSSATRSTRAPSAAAATGTAGAGSAPGGSTLFSSQIFGYRGTINITGATTVTLPFTQPHSAVGGGAVSAEGQQQTCARAAVVGNANFGLDASGDTWQVPGNVGDFTGPANVNVTVLSKQWQGPGTYGRDAFLNTSGVRINNTVYYDMSSAAAASLTVNPDGSGSLSFRDAPISGQSTPTISGSVVWTCFNHQA